MVEAYQDGYQYQVPWSVKQNQLQEGTLPKAYSFAHWSGKNLAFSSMKVALTSGDIMLRGFNMKDEETELQLTVPEGLDYAYKSNVIEETMDILREDTNRNVTVPVRKNEIVTIGLKK